MFHKLIFNIGVYYRNSKIFSHLSSLIETEFYSVSEQKLNQNIKLNTLLNHAVNNSSFYKEKYAGIDVNLIDIDSLSKLPVLSKAEFRANVDKIFCSNFNRKKCFLSETSGSTGDALIFYRDKDWDAAHRAAIYRGMLEFDVKPWDKSFYLWGFIYTPFSKLKTKFLDFLQNRKRLFVYNEEFNLLPIWKYLSTVSYIEGYSSVINGLAKKAIAQNKCFTNIKMVKCTSEKIFDSYHNNIKNAFNTRIVSEYGAAETGIIAFSCKQGMMHLVHENVILEVVEGKAIVTNLHSFSMPVIRYDLGDYVSTSNSTCACGRKGVIVNDILGRVGTNIYGSSGVYPSLTLYYVFKYLALEKNLSLSYQVVQNKKGFLDVYIFESLDLSDPSLVKLINNAFIIYFSNDIKIEIHKASNINKSSKQKDFVSHLSTS